MTDHRVAKGVAPMLTGLFILQSGSMRGGSLCRHALVSRAPSQRPGRRQRHRRLAVVCRKPG